MRTFSFQPEAGEPEIFLSKDTQPTLVQVARDRAKRNKIRARVREKLLKRGYKFDHLAIAMQEKGYGIKAICKATGIQTDVVKQLVLGEE